MNIESEKKSSFVEHLAELRSRLVKSVVYLFLFFIVCYFFAENIYSFLVAPYADAVKNDGFVGIFWIFWIFTVWKIKKIEK